MLVVIKQSFYNMSSWGVAGLIYAHYTVLLNDNKCTCAVVGLIYAHNTVLLNDNRQACAVAGLIYASQLGWNVLMTGQL